MSVQLSSMVVLVVDVGVVVVDVVVDVLVLLVVEVVATVGEAHAARSSKAMSDWVIFTAGQGRGVASQPGHWSSREDSRTHVTTAG